MSGVDPVLQAVARAGLALLFAATALHQLRDPHGFRVALGGYRVSLDFQCLPPQAAKVRLRAHQLSV